MGRRCIDIECPYLASDGTCLIPESDLEEKCQANERIGYEEKDYWIYDNFAQERLRSPGLR